MFFEPNTKSYRSGVKATKSFEPNLVRSELSKYQLVDMNDRGDYLFQMASDDPQYVEFVRRFEGKNFPPHRVGVDVRMGLKPNGELYQRGSGNPFGRGMLGTGNLFNDNRFYRRVYDDGSVIYVRYELIQKVATYTLRRDKNGAMVESLLTSSTPLAILDRTDDEVLWVKRQESATTADDETLLRLSRDQTDEIALPSGYRVIDRISETKNVVAGSFGSLATKEPIRAFLRKDSGWKELPIPDGFTFSFVQKVMNDGLILGFVTDANREKAKQVVWKEDAVVVLEDLPAWPKRGEYALVAQTTRRGDLYVRNVIDAISGKSENYLLHLSASRSGEALK